MPIRQPVIPAPEHHVYFAAFGFDDDPHQLTLLTGIEPDDIWYQGTPFSAVFPDALRRENRWILSSNLDQYASHADHFERLLLKLQRLGDCLDQLRAGYRCGIGVSQYYFMDDPTFYLPAGLLDGYRALAFPLTFDQLCLDG